MRAFYDGPKQVDSILSSKVITVPNNYKEYQKIQGPLIFSCQWYDHQTFKLFVLNENFPKLTRQAS